MSCQMMVIATYLRLTRKRGYSNIDIVETRLAGPKGPSEPPNKMARRCDITMETVEGFDVYTVQAKHAKALHRGTVVYLHGGAYVGQILRAHWKLIVDIAVEVGCPVIVPIYGLAPDHHVDEALTLTRAVLRTASATGPTYLVGDSSGGGLALSATLDWLTSGGLSPRGLTLISPWLDVSESNPAIADIEHADPWLSATGLRVYGKSWSGTVALDDPRVSPLFGDLDAIPPIDLYVGDRDVTVADSRLLRDKLPEDRMRYHEEPGAVHIYPLFPTPEGRRARRELIDHIITALTPQRPQPTCLIRSSTKGNRP